MSIPHPIFILASPRSFTSLVCAMLGQHPQAYGVPELNLLMDQTVAALVEKGTGPGRQRYLHGLLRTIAQLYAGEQTMDAIEMAYRWLYARSDWTTSDTYQELCRRAAPLRIVDKSPAYTSRVDSLNLILQTFPEAYFLHLTRHPRTQGESVMSVDNGRFAKALDSYDYSKRVPILDPQIAWYRAQINIMELLKSVPSHHQLFLRGEDVLGDPKTYLKKLCNWLQFDWNEDIYQIMLNPQDSPFACLGPFGAVLGNDIKFLLSPEFQSRPIRPSTLEGELSWRSDEAGFKPEVLDLAHELGYS